MADTAALHQEMWDCVQSQDWERLRELFHPDYRYTDVDGSGGGADEAVAMAKGYTDAFPDLAIDIRSQIVSGDKSCFEVTIRGTHTGPLQDIPATGMAVTVPGCNVIEVKDGLIYREADYFDTMTLLKQLGVSEG